MAAPSIAMDSRHQSSHKLNKAEKKFLRKQIKAKHTLLRHEGIETVSYATQNLVVANGGLGNGVSRNQLLPVLEDCGLVDALLMPPNKPYSFVRYKTTEESRKAHATLNGKEIVDDLGQKIILYLNFVEKAQWKELGPQALPPGLMVVEEIISSEDEKMLLESINWTEDTDNENFQKCLKHRRVKHFGYEFRYDNNNVDKDRPLPGGLPDICDSILEKWLQEGYIKHKPDQLTINQYQPGHGIPAHIDTHSAFEDEIISLSLGSEIVMDFKHPDGITVPVMLPRRSLLVMTGESRYLWTHGITPRKFDTIQASEHHKSGIITSDVGDLTLSKRGIRTSFTFRKVRRTPCNCSYYVACDSQRKESPPSFPESDQEASQLEREYVHRVYEEIAGHFSSTRHTPWPHIVEFLKALPDGSIVADIGCGNGKYLGINKELYMISTLPRASSRSPMQMQGPKDLDHLPLLSQAISTELDQKWSSWDLNWHLYGMLVPQAETHYATALAPRIGLVVTVARILWTFVEKGNFRPLRVMRWQCQSAVSLVMPASPLLLFTILQQQNVECWLSKNSFDS
ncbi:alkylated DNA repair protein alkB homolog 8 isoform X5 [Oryctolagus cuniculus]|uniref:alkylated DNA repair protein alkB homolog 8 isoform X5 n=1 Tax=Oryctolagus cuniculus TaxID=9986 RepID=UPI00222F8A18|nr:alkylated DNA repair protein alkB homolog 8 isoform X5 [Oryctolagus cuniculus]